MKEYKINIYELVGGSAAISYDDGQKVFKLISKSIDENLKVILDFNNIELITSPVLNTAIGQLFGIYSNDIIRKHIIIQNLSDMHLDLLKRVVDRAKEYFRDKQKMNKITKDSIENGK